MFLTGKPGVGKTSVLLRAAKVLQDKGYVVGGMITKDVRKEGVRVGFEIVNLTEGRKGWLAHISLVEGPQIGKYRVNLDDLREIGVTAINSALENPEVNFVVVDEVGPMELMSWDFKDVVTRAIDSQKPIIGTIHFRAHDPLINQIRRKREVKILEVTWENRSYLHKVAVDMLLKNLKASSESLKPSKQSE